MAPMRSVRNASLSAGARSSLRSAATKITAIAASRPTKTIAPSTCSSSGRFQSSGRMLA